MFDGPQPENHDSSLSFMLFFNSDAAGRPRSASRNALYTCYIPQLMYTTVSETVTVEKRRPAPLRGFVRGKVAAFEADIDA